MKKENIKSEEKNKNLKSRIMKVLLFIGVFILIVNLFGFFYDILTRNNKYFYGEKNLKIPILVYHDIVNTKEEVEFDYMQTTKETFEKQIKGLMAFGYHPISFKDLKEYKEGIKQIYKKSFLITFDDGYNGVYDIAYEFAKKYNIPMTVFIINEKVGTNACFDWEKAKEMHDSKLMGIYSHSPNHKKYTDHSKEVLVEDVENSYKELREKLEDEELLKVFCYPYGEYKDEMIKALEEKGYMQVLTDNKINDSNNLDLSRLHRIYPLEDSVFKMILKMKYRDLRYGTK